MARAFFVAFFLALLGGLGLEAAGPSRTEDHEKFLMPMPAEGSGPPVLVSADCKPVEPELAGLVGGGFVAAWTNELEELWIRRAGGRGESLWFDRRLFAHQSAGQELYRVAASPAGGFALAWVEPKGIFFWPFDNDGGIRGLTPVHIPGPPPTGHLELAADGVDGYVVVWFTESTMHLARVDAEGNVTRHDLPGIAGTAGLRSISADTDKNGVLWLLRRDVPPNLSPGPSILTVFRIPLDNPDRFEAVFSRQDPNHAAAVLAVDGQNRVIVAWNDGRSVLVQRFDSSSMTPSGPWEVVRSPQRVDGLDIATDAEGNVVLVWVWPFQPDTILTRTLGADGSFLGPTTEVVADVFSVKGPRLALTGPGEATVTWTRVLNFFPLSPQPPCTSHYPTIYVTRFPSAGARTLLLAEGRFRIEVEWQEPHGGSGRGHAIPGTEESGEFWFFDPDNTELKVKLLDGRPVNGHFWFFYGALSNVAYHITVTDQRTGLAKTYDNPPGRLASFADTFAFPGTS